MKSRFPRPSQVPLTGRFGFCFRRISSQPTKNKILVDVGSSAGTLEAKLKDLGFKKIIGVEPNEKAVKFSKNLVKNAEFYVSTADKLPVKDKIADFVTIFDVIEHVPLNGEVDALKEACRVLKKRGRLFLTTPNSNWITNILDPAWYLGHRHYRPDEIKSFIKKAGMKVKSIEVRGDIWSSMYFLWLYFSKWILKIAVPRNKWIEMMEDRGYEKPGIFTLFAEAEK